jgi:hypothetical protein
MWKTHIRNTGRILKRGFGKPKSVSAGLRYPRSSVFLNHWLAAQTAEEVVAREVFDRFKRFADHESGLSMLELLRRLHAAAGLYRKFIDGAARETGPIDRLELFGYRTSVLESEIIKPLILDLLDPDQPSIPQAQLAKALDVVESWMVRRMLVRATAKSYGQAVAEIIKLLHTDERLRAGVMPSRVSWLSNQAVVDIGRMTLNWSKSLLTCSPIVEFAAGGCAWCWRP